MKPISDISKPVNTTTDDTHAMYRYTVPCEEHSPAALGDLLEVLWETQEAVGGPTALIGGTAPVNKLPGAFGCSGGSAYNWTCGHP